MPFNHAMVDLLTGDVVEVTIVATRIDAPEADTAHIGQSAGFGYLVRFDLIGISVMSRRSLRALGTKATCS
jgi:hypothetical protein